MELRKHMERKGVLMTDLRTREAKEAFAYLGGLGYEMLSVPDGVCLWNETELEAWGKSLEKNLYAVIHPAPPLFLRPLSEQTEEDFGQAANEGILSAFCVTKVFGGMFRERREGVLIYLNSIHAEKPVGRGSLFSMGCGAVQMLAREVNQDYGTHGVRSFFVQRGISQYDPDGKSDLSNLYFGVEKRYPERKMPQADALNSLLAFLLTPGAAPLSGSDLRADGGMTMYYGERITEEQVQEIRRRQLLENRKEVTILGDV
jgi:NAD(P)-dependent dehydrogenase (short-subunit alcohol dehydrogenase family)